MTPRAAEPGDTRGGGGDPVLEAISRDECFELMRTLSIGRIAVAPANEPPLVLPVNYTIDGETVVFRTDPGTKLSLLNEQTQELHGLPMSFQVDLIDPFHRTGWSVLLRGLGYEVSPADLHLESWAGGPKHHWVRIIPGMVTGRRIQLPEATPDSRGYL
jgi:hypothetical protein